MTREECSDDEPAAGKPCDLEERTALFGEAIKELHLIFCKIYRG
jgi:hypothetical protein